MSSAQIVSLFYSSQDHSAKEKALQSLTSSQIAALQNKAAAAHHAHHAATHVAAAAAGLATLGLTAPPVTPYTPSPVIFIYYLIVSLMFIYIYLFGYSSGNQRVQPVTKTSSLSTLKPVPSMPIIVTIM